MEVSNFPKCIKHDWSENAKEVAREKMRCYKLVMDPAMYKDFDEIFGETKTEAAAPTSARVSIGRYGVG